MRKNKGSDPSAELLRTLQLRICKVNYDELKSHDRASVLDQSKAELQCLENIRVNLQEEQKFLLCYTFPSELNDPNGLKSTSNRKKLLKF